MATKAVCVQGLMISVKFFGDDDAQVMMVERFTNFGKGSIVRTVALVAADRLGMKLALFPLPINYRVAGKAQGFIRIGHPGINKKDNYTNDRHHQHQGGFQPCRQVFKKGKIYFHLYPP